MHKPKIYLDNCSYNRPFDDQMQIKIRLETEAKLYIQSNVVTKKYLLVWSYMLDFENDSNPYDEKRNAIGPWREIAGEYCPSSNEIFLAGLKYMEYGISAKDALHIACAVECNCEYFVTTDRKLLNKAVNNIRIINPIDFVREVEGL